MKFSALPLLLSLLISACASTSRTNAVENSVSQDRASIVDGQEPGCSVYVYRNKSSFHALNPEKPYLYADGEKIDRLVMEKTICLRLDVGKHTLTSKEPILFLPAYESGRLEIDIKLGDSPYYVRYSKEFSKVISSGGLPVAVGNTALQVVKEEDWKELR